MSASPSSGWPWAALALGADQGVELVGLAAYELGGRQYVELEALDVGQRVKGQEVGRSILHAARVGVGDILLERGEVAAYRQNVGGPAAGVEGVDVYADRLCTCVVEQAQVAVVAYAAQPRVVAADDESHHRLALEECERGVGEHGHDLGLNGVNLGREQRYGAGGHVLPRDVAGGRRGQYVALDKSPVARSDAGEDALGTVGRALRVDTRAVDARLAQRVGKGAAQQPPAGFPAVKAQRCQPQGDIAPVGAGEQHRRQYGMVVAHQSGEEQP